MKSTEANLPCVFNYLINEEINMGKLYPLLFIIK